MYTLDDKSNVKEAKGVRSSIKHSRIIPSASYVFPIKSLLTGIQPASEHRPQPLPSNAALATPEKAAKTRSGSAMNVSKAQEHLREQPDGDNLNPIPLADSEEIASTSRKQGERKRRCPNFRDFSIDENLLAPRIFSSGSKSPLVPTPDDSTAANVLFTSGPAGETVAYDPSQVLSDSADDDDLLVRRRAQLAEVAVEAFEDTTIEGILLPASPIPFGSVTEERAITNFSKSGIVHLAPVDNQHASPSFRSGSAGSSSRGRTSRNSDDDPISLVVEQIQTGSEGVDVVRLPSALPACPPFTISGSASPSLNNSSKSTNETGSSSEGPHITFRYQHMEDENGHHLIVGREGSMTKCEDEPIRTPGAVQGFGVLIAIEEDEETGNLVVRQVSENSTELLGLSPQYLFSLECFTQTLSDPQADILFDNIQYLSDTALTPEEQAENLHVFMLTGWGAPETALREEHTTDPQRRRGWTSWCAAHRPQMTAPGNLDSNGESTDAATNKNIIILEFELERDAFNPLYPPTIRGDSRFGSGISSPSDASGSTSESSGRISEGSGSTSESSGRTLVSTDSEGAAGMSGTDGSTPSLPITDPSLNASVTANSPTPSSQDSAPSPLTTSESTGEEEWMPSPEDILESTTSRSKPLLALERLRRSRRGATESPASPASFSPGFDGGGSRPRRAGVRNRRGGGAVGMMDVFAVMAQINEQLGAAPDLDSFLQVVVGVIKDLTQFHRVLVYQFDEAWNGKVVAELVDWTMTHDLYKGLHFPAADIPAQARDLYALNKVRLLYDRGQPTARIVVRSRRDLETPLDMTHCYLRAMSPIHLKYLGNMGVRASMSVSIIAFGQLWGLVACHSYGPHGMRVSFPVRQMLRLLSQSISRNVERLSYAQRLYTRKLINTMPSDQHPSGYIVSNADDLLGLFDADYGVLVIGEGAKILGPNQHSQEILIVAEYLRLKQFDTMQVSQAVTVDYPDLQLSTGLEVIAGLLYVPLSMGGRDFIAFLRKGQPRQVKWAGRPYKQGDAKFSLEPRRSFKLWSETVAGRCRAWTDEHLETAGVLALVYGKFIEVWRQKETALQTTKLTNILLSNASHEVRTPLNHIINYLELALNGHLDGETRENLSQSHAASKSLLFTINDLLDLTRLESGHETSFNESFDLQQAIEEATLLYKNEAHRRGLGFDLDMSQCPKIVVGDSKKIRTVVSNLTANAVKYTSQGMITIECHAYEEPAGLRNSGNIAVEIVVADTGCGIPSDKLESIFREFEQVEVAQPPKAQSQGLGLGLAVVARIVEQLGGQLRVDSKIDEGSRFSFLIPFATESENNTIASPSTTSFTRSLPRSRANSHTSRDDQMDNLMQALSSSHMGNHSPRSTGRLPSQSPQDSPGCSEPLESESPSMKQTSMYCVDESEPVPGTNKKLSRYKNASYLKSPPASPANLDNAQLQLRVLIVEDNDINRTILAKRLSLDGHIVVNTTNGQEGLEMVEGDRDFDCILMDIQMPLLNGYEATERIRALEQDAKDSPTRFSHKLNGRLPIFAVSASLIEEQREDMYNLGIDGWILKPIDFKRLRIILKGVTDLSQREKDVYKPGCNWEIGGWLAKPRPILDDYL